jgi:hypothetical protein
MADINSVTINYDYNSKGCFNSGGYGIRFKKDRTKKQQIHISNLSADKNMKLGWVVKHAYKMEGGVLKKLTDLSKVNPFGEQSPTGTVNASKSRPYVVAQHMGIGGENGGYVVGEFEPVDPPPCGHVNKSHTEWHIDC